MVDLDVLAAKLRELAERLARVREHCRPDAAALAGDRDALDLVSFNLMLAVQVCVDVASHLIADEGWPLAATAAQSFQRLFEHGVISQGVADMLGRATGLRNVVAHGYAGVDPEQIHRAATEGLADLERFASEVGAWVSGRASS
jgi:uncharacterized protein YutE (UPF0331/DUF86 family)